MSFSKTFFMTRYRLGYVITHERYVKKATTVAAMTAPRPATFVYARDIAALRKGMPYVEERRLDYDERRKYFCDAIDDIKGLGCRRFEGVFYAWFDIGRLGISFVDFVNGLIEQKNVRVLQGKLFGLNTDNYILVPLVQPVPVLKKAAELIDWFVESL